MSLRIAQVTATFPPYQGGTGNVCYHNARELAQHGHEVHVFTAGLPGAPAREVREGFIIHRLHPLLQVGNAPVLPDLIPALRGFDILHLHYPFVLGAEMVRLASIRYRIPFVVSFHNDLIGQGLRAHVFSLYQRLSAHLTMRAAAQLCAVSLDHYQSSCLRQMLAERAPPVVELSNGVDTDHFCPGRSTVRERYGIPAEAKLVLFVAALDRAHHFKGLDALLQAFRTLPSDMWLLIVGDGDLRPAYERQAAQLGLVDRTRFAGAVPHAETPPFYRGADLTVLPSSPPESFGLVLVESLACGTPVVASAIPGVRTVVDHGHDGLLVPAHNAASLAEAIRQVLRDEAARQAMGRQGRAKVMARYHWERIGSHLEIIYRHALGQSQTFSGIPLPRRR